MKEIDMPMILDIDTSIIVTTTRVDDQHVATKYGPTRVKHTILGNVVPTSRDYASASRLPYPLVMDYLELEREAMAALSRRFARKVMPVVRTLAQLYLGRTIVRREPEPAFYDAHDYVCRNNLWKDVKVKFWVRKSTGDFMRADENGLVEVVYTMSLPAHKPTEKIVEHAAAVFRWLKNDS